MINCSRNCKSYLTDSEEKNSFYIKLESITKNRRQILKFQVLFKSFPQDIFDDE